MKRTHICLRIEKMAIGRRNGREKMAPPATLRRQKKSEFFCSLPIAPSVEFAFPPHIGRVWFRTRHTRLVDDCENCHRDGVTGGLPIDRFCGREAPATIGPTSHLIRQVSTVHKESARNRSARSGGSGAAHPPTNSSCSTFVYFWASSK